MNSKVRSNFQKMIDVNLPIIYINDFDFARIDALIREAVGSGRKILEWNPGTGSTNFDTKVGNSKIDLETFLVSEYAIEPIRKIPENVLVLKEIHDFIDTPKIKTLLQLFAQRKLYDRKFESMIIIVDSKLRVPEEISKYVSFLEIEFPNEEEINKLIDEHVEENGYSLLKEEDKAQLRTSLQGMTAFEIDRMLDMAMSSNGTLTAEDRAMILQSKKQMVKNSGVMELVDTPDTIDQIGGMTALKEYLGKKAQIYKRLSEARLNGVVIPKGVFIVGMPGCGKSLCAKATATLFGSPLLKLDMGSMMGKYVGESEANLRKALKIAEASAPCIVWIDEIEKAFSGLGGNDILTRMYGYFLTWMQDKKSAVYVIATANRADCLPPELKRKGRFDEIFCVDLPNAQEREAIFKVHFRKRNISLSEEDLKFLASDKCSSGFNGADIEAVINETMEDCFIQNKQFDRFLLGDKIKEAVSISKSCSEQISKMKEQFEKNSFKDANTGKITSSKKAR